MPALYQSGEGRNKLQTDAKYAVETTLNMLFKKTQFVFGKSENDFKQPNNCDTRVHLPIQRLQTLMVLPSFIIRPSAQVW